MTADDDLARLNDSLAAIKAASARIDAAVATQDHGLVEAAVADFFAVAEESKPVTDEIMDRLQPLTTSEFLRRLADKIEEPLPPS